MTKLRTLEFWTPQGAHDNAKFVSERITDRVIHVFICRGRYFVDDTGPVYLDDIPDAKYKDGKKIE